MLKTKTPLILNKKNVTECQKSLVKKFLFNDVSKTTEFCSTLNLLVKYKSLFWRM